MPAGIHDSKHDAFRRTQFLALALALPFVIAGWVHGLSADSRLSDFRQYYMGALMAREGEWESLYPIPNPEATDNAGWSHASRMRPTYARLAAESGIGDVNRFIQPPPMALLLAPLAWLPYPQAHVVWLLLMTLAALGVSLAASRFYYVAGGERPWIAAALVFGVACSPLMVRTLRTSQITPAVAFCIGTALFGLHARNDLKTAVTVSLGALAKYVTLVLLPLAVVARRYRLLAWIAALSAAIVLVTWAVTGSGPFEVFLYEIAPTFSHSSPWQGNQGISGSVLRFTGRESLDTMETATVRLVGVAILAFLFVVIFRRSKLSIHNATWLPPSACSLVAWFLIFSPISWDHYHLYLCPFWGWLVREAEKSTRWRIPILAALASSASSLAVFPGVQLPEPLLSHMLWSSIFFLAYSAYRLISMEATLDSQLYTE